MTPCSTTQEQPNNQTLSGTLVSYADNIKVSKTVPRNLAWVIDEIRASDELKAKVERIRSASSDVERRQLKQSLLPYFTFLQFTNGTRESKSFKSVQYVLMDIDHVQEQLAELCAAMREDPDIFMFFVSPSGDGLKVVFALDREITTEAEYKSVYQYFRSVVRDRFGAETDDIKDVARACFLSHDPDIYLNPSSGRFSPDACKSQETAGRGVPSGHAAHSILSGVAPGERTHSMTRLIGLHMEKGFDCEYTLEFIRMWNQQNTPPHSDAKLVETVRDMYDRYYKAPEILPARFQERNNSYYKNVKQGNSYEERMITSFVIQPRELLVLENNDCLVCDVKSSQGYEYRNILIESSDWHSKQKLLKAIGHQDCVCIGSDNDLQALCAYINTLVPVRKSATKVIGLHENVWVVGGMNITSAEISREPDIVPYDKGSGAFHHKISYSVLPEKEHADMAKIFYENVLHINERKVILPFLGWVMATPMKELVRKHLGSFPSILVHGGQGSGKTSTAKMFMRLSGYKNAVPNKCDMKPFPMLKNLSATNGIPQFYDEFKQIDMKDDAVDSLLRYIREIYDGELEQKGREDQTTVDYELLAPMAVLGEWNINQPAIRERALMIRFSNAVKGNGKMQGAFKALLALPLEGFMPGYIQFCLQQDIPGILEESRKFVEEYFGRTRVAPRILNNLAVMLLGLVLFQEYAQSCKIPMPAIEPESILSSQLKEITGTESGNVRSSVDQFIEELAIMWQKNSTLLTIPWWKESQVDRRRVIAIRFNRVFPEFKEYAQRTKYEGDLLDKESYLRMFKECDYIISASHPVSFDGQKQRCLIVDVEKATKAGLDLEGFGVTDVTP